MDGLPVRTSYQFCDTPVGVILLNGNDMHDATAIWKATGKAVHRSPAIFLQNPDAVNFIDALAAEVGVRPDNLYHHDSSGYWFTQRLAIKYASWISPHFEFAVQTLAIQAAKDLARQNDPLFQEVRQQGKLAHAEVSNTREQFAPLRKNGRDVKHEYANAALCRGLTGKNPCELRRSLLGGKAKGSIWDKMPARENALRLLALVEENPKLKSLLARTSDPNKMISAVEENAKKIRGIGRQLEG